MLRKIIIYKYCQSSEGFCYKSSTLFLFFLSTSSTSFTGSNMHVSAISKPIAVYYCCNLLRVCIFLADSKKHKTEIKIKKKRIRKSIG